ncbi:Leucine-rich repeat-containing N-terminal plant-type domain-containing protein [Plasmodiophora brassicae]
MAASSADIFDLSSLGGFISANLKIILFLVFLVTIFASMIILTLFCRKQQQPQPPPGLDGFPRVEPYLPMAPGASLTGPYAGGHGSISPVISQNPGLIPAGPHASFTAPHGSFAAPHGSFAGPHGSFTGLHGSFAFPPAPHGSYAIPQSPHGSFAVAMAPHGSFTGPAGGGYAAHHGSLPVNASFDFQNRSYYGGSMSQQVPQQYGYPQQAGYNNYGQDPMTQQQQQQQSFQARSQSLQAGVSNPSMGFAPSPHLQYGQDPNAQMYGQPEQPHVHTPKNRKKTFNNTPHTTAHDVVSDNEHGDPNQNQT